MPITEIRAKNPSKKILLDIFCIMNDTELPSIAMAGEGGVGGDD